MKRNIQVAHVDMDHPSKTTVTMSELDQSFYDPNHTFVSKFSLFMACKEQQAEIATLRAEFERLLGHMKEIDSIVDECEYDKKTRKTVDRLRHIAKEALK